jgi:hypothetical protein
MKLFLFILASVAALGASPTAFADEVLDRLRSVPGLRVEEGAAYEGLRRFDLEISQPEDHFSPGGPVFRHKAVLLHRDFREPMVLVPMGYRLSVGLSRLTTVFETNQLIVEHRFFGSSITAQPDWAKLTVRQAAADIHRVVMALKPLYSGKWVSTGSSKGGMASIFHRRFHPTDVDGTVANTAPISFERLDDRYNAFLAQVGGEKHAECRQRLLAFQRELLSRKDEILPLVEGSFERIGGKGAAFDRAVRDMNFGFWVGYQPISCHFIPRVGDPPEALLRGLESINDSVSENAGDGHIKKYEAYYYQAALELGMPALLSAPFDDLGAFADDSRKLLPIGQDPVYSSAQMRDVEKWVATEASSLMLLYGELDPWTAGAYRKIHEGADNHFYVVPKGNHSVDFSVLEGDAKKNGWAAISRWLGKGPR